MKFPAVAFDLDGTLYPDYRLNLRLIPFMVKELRLLRAMGKARKLLHSDEFSTRYTGDAGENFYDLQARLMGEALDMPAEKAREMAEQLIYRGWEPIFKRIRLFPHVRETLDAFRDAGIKLGLLSDFPPETKLRNLGIREYFSTVLCSETIGRLKPGPAPFLELAGRLETPPEQILYVGNSVPYDVEGARRAGMKAALIRPKWKKRLSGPPIPAFVFSGYRQLCDFVLS